MTPLPNPKPNALEERPCQLARDVRSFVRRLPRSVTNLEDLRQLARASGSVGADYVEADEALGKKDFRMRVKICRKEAKEARYWLRLVDLKGDEALEGERERLVQEASELLNIFSSIEVKTR